MGGVPQSLLWRITKLINQLYNYTLHLYIQIACSIRSLGDNSLESPPKSPSSLRTKESSDRASLPCRQSYQPYPIAFAHIS